MVKTLDMTQGKPAPLILKFALPLIIANLFQQVYSVVDIVIVGRWVGANAFSAVGVTIAPTNVLMAVCIGVTIGIGVVISQYFGAKDNTNAPASIMNGFYICFAVAAAITVAGLLLTKPLLRLLNTPDILMPDAIIYMQVLFGGFLGVTAYYAVFAAIRALGDSKTPLYFMIAANILNIGLDILFVVPLKMGVFGAALATILSQFLTAICCIIYAFKTIPYFKKALHHIKPNIALLKQILKVGIPAAFQYSLVFLSSTALQGVINKFGTSVIGAFTATSRIEILVQQPFYALATSIVTFTGQNIGAGKYDRVKEGIRIAVKASAVYSLVLLAVFWAGGRFVMSIFVDDAEIISLAATGIRIISIFFFPMGINQIFRNMLTGAGDSFYALGNGIVEVAGRVGFAALLTNIAIINIWGLWAATVLTWLIACLFALWRYKSGIWTTKSLISARAVPVTNK